MIFFFKRPKISRKLYHSSKPTLIFFFLCSSFNNIYMMAKICSQNSNFRGLISFTLFQKVSCFWDFRFFFGKKKIKNCVETILGLETNSCLFKCFIFNNIYACTKNQLIIRSFLFKSPKLCFIAFDFGHKMGLEREFIFFLQITKKRILRWCLVLRKGRGGEEK